MSSSTRSPSTRCSTLVALLSVLSSFSASIAANADITGPYTAKGCYKSFQPLQDQGQDIYQARGPCKDKCGAANHPVFGLYNGSNCFCGDLLPALADKIDDSNCNAPCQGFPKETCGGSNAYGIFITGAGGGGVANFEPASTSTTKSTAVPTTVTQGGSTVIMTVGPSPTDGSAGGGGGGGGHGGASIGGIVAGVVVGLIVIGCISAAVLFLVRRRKWRQSDALDGSNSSNPFSDANKQHSINSAVPNDSRLDPSLMRRRMSDGSIADNEDFSRRILTVTNPDHA